MNAKKIFKYILIIVLCVLVVYLFVAVRPLNRELSFKPEWTIDIYSSQLSPLPEKKPGDGDELIPFRIGNTLGFVTGSGVLVNRQNLTYDGTVGNNLYCLYSQTQIKSDFYGTDGKLSVSIKDSGFPFITDYGIYVFSPGGDSVAAYDFQGNLVWERQSSDVITAFNDSESGTILGYSNGQLTYIDKNGETVFSFIPGGSQYPLIFGAAISSDGRYAACISGVENQRFILISIKDKQYKIIHHEYLSQDIKTNLLVQFDNDSGYVYYQRAEGLGVVSLKTKKVHIIPVKGRVAYIGTDNSNLTAVHSITGDGENIVSIYENPYYLLAETKFSCNDSYLIQRGNSIYLGIDKTLSKINLLEQ